MTIRRFSSSAIRFLLLNLLASIVIGGGVSRAAGTELKPPTPIWRFTGLEQKNPAVDTTRADQVVVTPDTVLFGCQGVAALDRKTGNALWQRRSERSYRQQEKQQVFNSTEWSLAGWAQAASDPGVAVLWTVHETTLLENGVAHTQRQSELIGMDLYAGTERWHVAMELETGEQARRHPLGVFDSVVALASYDKATRLQFWNAFTGASLDAAKPADHLLLQQAAARQGARFLLAGTFPWTTLLRFDPQAADPISLSNAFNAPDCGTVIGLTDNRLIVRIDEDNGSVGHSVWPKYLLCYMVNGHLLWRFPRHYLSGIEAAEGRPGPRSTIQWAFVLPASGVVFTWDYTDMYGVRLRDGKLLWKRKQPRLGIVDGVAYGRGALILAAHDFQGRDNSTWLGYLQARTGTVRRLCRLPSSSRLFVDGDDLYVIGTTLSLTRYSCRSLFKADTARQVSALTSDHK